MKKENRHEYITITLFILLLVLAIWKKNTRI